MREVPYGSDVYRRGASLVEYARGAGGRIDILSGGYLDLLAEAIVHVHPKTVSRRVRELLVSGRFRRSTHPQLRDVSLAELRRRATDQYTRDYARRLERGGDDFRAAESRRISAYQRRRGSSAMVE